LGVARACVVVLATAVVMALCGQAWAQTAQRVRLPLPSPQGVAIGDDGSVWITDEDLGLARLRPDGRIQWLARDMQIGDITNAYGALWFAGTDAVGRIDANGTVKTWPIPGNESGTAITAAGGALWFTSEDARDHINRLSTSGAVSRLALSGAPASLDAGDIAGGPDGALWFTQRDGIGRVTTGGAYSSRQLPRRGEGPADIVTGPDGALWFTEYDARAIGRITTAGAITEFPLGTELENPGDIVAAPDGALWFTTDNCIGRITTGGGVTEWPVGGALHLADLAAAADGTFWVADDVGGAVWHFVPPAGYAAPAVPCGPPTFTRASGTTRATLTYRRYDRFKNDDLFVEPRLSISRAGRELFTGVVPSLHFPSGPPLGAEGDTGRFAVRDLDHDGEPEAMLELDSQGTHCCVWSRVYRYVASRNGYVATDHVWGDYAATPRVRDLDHNGRVEFVSRDDRFRDAYDNLGWPIRIFRYRHGTFRDVTHLYPSRIERDAARSWRLYLQHRSKRNASGRATLAAWAADEYRLGRGAAADAALAEAAGQGFLGCGGVCYHEPTDPFAYIRSLKAFLRKTGYIRG
jgi:virginiamycin B lyase